MKELDDLPLFTDLPGYLQALCPCTLDDLLLKLESTHVFWQSGFGWQPEQRGWEFSVGYFQNLAYSGWFLKIAYPNFKKKKKKTLTGPV